MNSVYKPSKEGRLFGVKVKPCTRPSTLKPLVRALKAKRALNPEAANPPNPTSRPDPGQQSTDLALGFARSLGSRGERFQNLFSIR